MIASAFQSWSLKSRATLFTLSIFLVGIWSLALYASRHLESDMQRQVGEQLLATASFLAEEIGDELGDRILVLKTVAGKLAPEFFANPKRLQSLLEERLILHDQFNAGIVAIGSNGIAIAEIPRTIGAVGVDFSDREHVAGALKQGKVTVGRPVVGKSLRTPIFVIAMPVRAPDGRVIGALNGLTDLSKPNFLDKIAAGRYGKTGGYLLISSSDRVIVTASDKSRIMQPVPEPGVNPLFDRYMQGYEGFGITTDSHGVKVLSASKRVPGADWFIVARIPALEAFAPIDAMQQRMLAAALVLTLVAGGLIWWMLRRELAPVLSTAKTLAALSQSRQPAQPLPVGRQDEFGALVGAFNGLLESLAQREDSLRRSEQRSRAIIDASPVPLAIVDTDENIGFLNAAFQNSTGYTKEDIPTLAHWWQCAYPDPDYRHWAMENWRTQVVLAEQNGTTVAPREVEICCKDGRKRTFLISAVSIPVGDAARSYLVALFDIDERKRAEKARIEAEHKYRLLFERANDGLYLQDATGFVDCNETGAAMYGLSRRELIGRSPVEFAPQRQADGRLSAEVAAEKIAAVMKGESPRFEWQYLRTDGAIRDAEIALNPVEVGGAVYLLAIVRDITERKLAEAQRDALEAKLRESQKMEALGTLAGGVAHDFNNALATITGNVTLARQDVGPEHAALVSLDEIDKASRRAKDLVQQILAFGRRQTLDRKPTTLSLVVLESARLIRATLPGEVAFEVNCRPDTPIVLADATQVKQVLLNLCQNALHAVQDQGRPGVIEVRLQAHAQSETRGDLRSGRYACLSVRDNGSGMDESTKRRIFEPFFTTKPKGKGTGLGLSVVHGIVRAHEAVLEVQSSPGSGSEFRIYFPAGDTHLRDAPAAARDAVSAEGAGKRVLYVDDEDAIVFLMTRLLERRGYRVDGHTRPQDALAEVRADPQRYDIVVTDYSMPGMSGLELAAALHALRADLPVVLASGYITEDLREQAPAAGVRELIYKPDTVEELCDAVARAACAQDPGNAPT